MKANWFKLEAAQKCKCPFTFLGETFSCIGDACMAWDWFNQGRKSHVPYNAENLEIEPERPNDVPSSWEFENSSESDDGIASWIEPEEEAKKRWVGTCRLIYKSDTED